MNHNEDRLEPIYGVLNFVDKYMDTNDTFQLSVLNLVISIIGTQGPLFIDVTDIIKTEMVDDHEEYIIGLGEFVTVEDARNLLNRLNKAFKDMDDDRRFDKIIQCKDNKYKIFCK